MTPNTLLVAGLTAIVVGIAVLILTRGVGIAVLLFGIALTGASIGARRRPAATARRVNDARPR